MVRVHRRVGNLVHRVRLAYAHVRGYDTGKMVEARSVLQKDPAVIRRERQALKKMLEELVDSEPNLILKELIIDRMRAEKSHLEEERARLSEEGLSLKELERLITEINASIKRKKRRKKVAEETSFRFNKMLFGIRKAVLLTLYHIGIPRQWSNERITKMLADISWVLVVPHYLVATSSFRSIPKEIRRANFFRLRKFLGPVRARLF